MRAVTVHWGLMLLLACSAAAGAEGVRASNAQLERIATGYSFTEGPASDKKGNVYFTDQPNDRIWKWSVDGKLSVFLEACGRANGLCFDKDGGLWACADANNELWRILPNGKHEVIVKDYRGKLLNGPNDVWVRPDGSVYITDPFYKRPYWKRGEMEQECQGVYCISPDRKTVTRVVEDMRQPNGIIGTPDGKRLYVSDIGAGKTYSYSIKKGGGLEDKRLFCSLGSDGMTIDSEGNVYLTGNGVTVFDKSGAKIDHVDVPEGWTGNVCFGGKDGRTLFVTASTSIYTLQMRVHGVGSQ